VGDDGLERFEDTERLFVRTGVRMGRREFLSLGRVRFRGGPRRGWRLPLPLPSPGVVLHAFDLTALRM